MGEIFRAEMDGPAGIKKRVVIKRVLPHLARDERFVERFLDEGRLMVQLSHGNVIPVFDVGVFQGQYFLAMEYVEGMDLAELRASFMEVESEFTPSVVAAVMDMVSRALDYVHTCADSDGNPLNIVHRDISPPNLMVSVAGEVKILDFGIARARTHVVESMPGLLVGKLGYMAPEQITGHDSSPLSDIYGLGAVAYELLTGQMPHPGSTDVEVLDHIRNEPPVPVFELKPDAPEALSLLIDSCIASDPAARPPDCATLRTQILEVIRKDDLSGGEEVLRDLVRSFYDAKPQTANFDHLLDAQLRAGISASEINSAGHTDVISVGDSAGISETAALEGGGVGPVTPQPRLLRWLFVTAIIGVFAGLSLMFLLERSAPSAQSTERMDLAAANEASGAGKSVDNREGVVADPARNALVNSQIKAEGHLPTEASAQEVGTSGAHSGKQSDAPSVDAPALVTLQIRVTPGEAEIRLGKKVLGVGSAIVEGKAGDSVSLSISSAGFASRKPSLVLGEYPSKHIRLQRLEAGRLEFRFFPARAKVLLDGKTLDTHGSNRVSRDVAVGKHRVVVRDPVSGAEKTMEVRIDSDSTRSLGTIEVGEKEEPVGSGDSP